MIEKLIEFSIQKRIAVLIATGVLTLIGLYNAAYLSVDAVPDVTNVQVSAVTSSPGLSPTEVEQFITYPIEIALTGIPDVTEIRSISRTGVSSVTVIFKDSVNIWFARQLVNERLKNAEADIPPGYGKPELSPVATGLGDIYEFVLTSDRHTPMELRTYMDWELGKKLKALPGVIDINTIGGEVKQYQILIDPRRLAAHNLNLSIILSRLKNANANVGGGYIMKGNEQLVIRGEGQFKSTEELSRTAIRTGKDGIPLLLGQVAQVQIGPAIRFGLATKKDKGEVVAATVMMLIGENSREIVKIVKKRIEELKKNLPEGMKIEPFYDRSEFINRALQTVFTNLTEGALLVFIVLVIALGTVKGGALVAIAIPVSMLVAVIFMRQLGVIGNLMSLGAIDFGLLVDGPIVLLESILAAFYAKKALFDTTPEGDRTELTQSIIITSCTRVARAATFSVAIIMLVYLPLMVLEGVEGRMFRPMAVTVSLALASALLFSLTTFPAAVSLLFKEPAFHHSHYWDTIEEKYKKFLNWGMERKKHVVLGSIALFVFSLIIGYSLGAEFLPRIDEGEFDVDVRRLPSTSINHSRDLNMEIEKVLSTFPEVLSAVSKVGRGESAAEPIGTDEGSIMVKLKDKKDWKTADNREDLMSAMKDKILANVPSSYISMSQPIENRVNSLISGSKADVVIKIYGDDLAKLKSLGEEFAEVLKQIKGTGDLRVQRVLGLPILEIKANREKMARYGVTAAEILDTVETMRVGAGVGKVFEGLRRFDLVVRLDVDVSDLDIVENIPVMTSTGITVPLSLVADIQKVEGPASITREALKRRLFVEVNIRGRDLVGYISEAQSKTKSITDNLPEGYEVDWGGQFENFTRAKNRLAMVVPFALIIIFGMLIAAFGNVFYALGVFLVVPLAVSGGIISLVIRGLPFSIPAGVGFIAVSGIAVLNGVVYAFALKEELEEGKHLSSAVFDAALSSNRPVITTSVIAAVGFIPMAISTAAGAEVQRPLATVVIGGVLIATVLSRLLLPIIMEFLFKKFHVVAEMKIHKRRAEDIKRETVIREADQMVELLEKSTKKRKKFGKKSD
ncbi:MAG: CusA/CzcA family heavy metal efflux RND transporter [Leptospira sp.]|nr:CusA/CzcA family heavy metal efflux RND transporter [Leptospira sp.]